MASVTEVDPSPAATDAPPATEVTDATDGASSDDSESADAPAGGADLSAAAAALSGAAGVEGAAASKHSRAEKKSRKALQKLGFKPVTGITRATIKKSKNILFVVTKPDVVKAPNTDTYVVFGEAKIEDLASAAQRDAAEQFKMPDAAPGGALGTVPGGLTGMLDKEAGAAAPAAAAADADAEGDVDETGLEPKDIELVMQQADVSRAKAVRALRSTNGDLVNAIMELTL